MAHSCRHRGDKQQEGGLSQTDSDCLFRKNRQKQPGDKTLYWLLGIGRFWLRNQRPPGSFAFPVDEFVLPETKDAKTESIVTLAAGLPNTQHTLEIYGSDATPIATVRIYHAPLGQK